MSKSLLLTGHTGFVGTNLIRAFQKDYELFGLDIITPADQTNASPLPPEKTFSWDLPGEIPPVDTIIHLAGKAHDTASVSTPEEYFEVNLGLTKRIFDYFMQSRAKKFVFFSSVKAVADTVEGKILTESQQADPKTPYGRSKLAAEQYIGGFSGDHKENMAGNGKKQVYILRPCMIHGPGNKGNLNLLYNIVRKGIPWPLGAFHNQRSFLSIENLIYIVNQIIQKDIDSGVYQVADDNPISTNDLIRLMAESLNKKPKIWSLPPPLIKGMAHAGDLLRLPLNSERLKKLTESYVVSNHKIKKALNVSNLPVEAQTGIKNTLQAF